MRNPIGLKGKSKKLCPQMKRDGEGILRQAERAWKKNNTQVTSQKLNGFGLRLLFVKLINGDVRLAKPEIYKPKEMLSLNSFFYGPFLVK